MTEHGEDPGDQIERSTHQLEHDLERLENHLDDAKGRLADRQAEAGRLERAEDVAGDWEEKRPDPERPQGDDPAQ